MLNSQPCGKTKQTGVFSKDRLDSQVSGFELCAGPHAGPRAWHGFTRLETATGNTPMLLCVHHAVGVKGVDIAMLSCECRQDLQLIYAFAIGADRDRQESASFSVRNAG